ncbi:MAG: hypothetical protein KGL94_05810 [Acidobacteriota bacterium]|nr:hypothetical protein [Acidobacteriota bacterium]
MSWFRRNEPLHERLAREGGLVEPEPRAPWREVGIHGMQRVREWDATETVEAPGIEGDAARFVALPDGSLLVEEGPDSSLQPLADAIEQDIQPPYRARAARQDGDLWAVQARRIRVMAIRRAPEGNTIELTRDGLVVDGERAFGSVPELEGLGDVVRAERLDGDLWEVQASAL